MVSMRRGSPGNHVLWRAAVAGNRHTSWPRGSINLGSANGVDLRGPVFVSSKPGGAGGGL